MRVGLVATVEGNVDDTLLGAVRAPSKLVDTRRAHWLDAGGRCFARAAVAVRTGRLVRAAVRLLSATSDLLLGPVLGRNCP